MNLHHRRTTTFACVLLLIVIAVVGGLSRQGSAEPGKTAIATAEPAVTYPTGTLPGSDGKPASLAELKGPSATLLVFLSVECPISNGYVPTLNALSKEHAGAGLQIVGLNTNVGPSLKDLAEHKRQYEIAFPVLKDAGAKVATSVGAQRCPEVCLFDKQGVLRYRGRIDDRYAQRGKGANAVTSDDLKQAVDAVLAGREVAVTRTVAVGCPILKEDRPQAPATAVAVSYSQHIAPVLQKNCLGCHREGGIGPFALETYDQAVLWSEDLRTFTKNKSMPPWMPEKGHGDFTNSRAMTDAEISLIDHWVTGGCPQGDLKLSPPAPQFTNGWTLGEPDLILTTDAPYSIPADGQDIYRCFVLPTSFDKDRYVKAVEVRAGNTRVVHHVLTFLDVSGESVALDAADAGPGYSTRAGYPGFLPRGGLGGWAPGNTPGFLPTGVAKVLPQGARVVMQVHYHPTGKPEADQTQLGIYFAKEPITRVTRTIPFMPVTGPLSNPHNPLGSSFSQYGLRIPAGAKNHEVTATLTMPRDAQAVTITPHMHLLGKDMRVTATLPDGTVVPLVSIPQWDFNWQESYRYREPVSLPAGTRIDLVAHFDNSAENRRNPHHPPKEVTWGEQTHDEMCMAFIEVIPRQAAASPEELKMPTPAQLLTDFIRSRVLVNARKAAARPAQN